METECSKKANLGVVQPISSVSLYLRLIGGGHTEAGFDHQSIIFQVKLGQLIYEPPTVDPIKVPKVYLPPGRAGQW